MLRYLEKHQLHLRYILLTHGHFDHIWGVDQLQKATGCKVVCHAADEELLKNPSLASSSFGALSCPSCHADLLVQDKDTLTVGEMRFTFLHTPGHSKGSMVILTDSGLFTGDTLFAGSIGRTDLYGGDMTALNESLRKLDALAFDGAVYPGHGEATSMAIERKQNLYLLQAAGRIKGASYDDLF
jgi:glyoxylase-like metal-dependent hydrolase (beta-lactamase superfamily II)